MEKHNDSELRKMLDTRKGLRTSKVARSICESVRDLYDVSVIGLHEKDPELLSQMTDLLEEIFIMGIKMSKKLMENKINDKEAWRELWEENSGDFNYREVVRKRKERRDIIIMLEENDRTLEQYNKDKKNKKDKK